MGRVSRASPVHTVMRNCSRDEGGPFGFGDQEPIPSHRKLLRSKAVVVYSAERDGGWGLPGWWGLGASYGKLELTPLQKAWVEASNEMFKGKINKADAVDPDFMKHVVWYSARDWKRPFPGDTEIKWPDEFVKAALARPHDDGDDDDKPLP